MHKTLILLAVLTATSAAPVGAQPLDPQDVINRLIREHQIQDRQRFEDEQRERLRQRQRDAYDDKRCREAGYATLSPEYDRCMRGLAAYRQGLVPNGRPVRPVLECNTVADVGIANTTCY